MAANMLKIVSELKTQIAALEAMIGAASGAVAAVAKKADKPKKPLPPGMKAWQEFNKRLRELLKTNESDLAAAELMKFASKLKKEKVPAEWTDAEILEARAAWAEEHAPACPVCDKDVASDPPTHRDCARIFVSEFVTLGKGTDDEGLVEWTKLSGVTVAAPPAEKKKVGRPKMTEEAKAAAAAAKAAMTPDEKAAAKAAREAKKATPPKKTAPVKPDAPVKAPKVAWGGADLAVTDLSDELESVASVN